MTCGTTAPGTPARRPALDLLRLVSALMVLGFHYGFRMAASGRGGAVAFPDLAPAALWADAGLLVFFTISGYVIALSAENRTAYGFAVGRLARLWPAFVVCATATALVTAAWPVPGTPAPTLAQWAAQLVIVSRLLGQPAMDGAYWTIEYEVVFYAWVTVLIASGLPRRRWILAVAAWLVLSVLNETAIGSGALRKVFLTDSSGFFAFGMLVFQAQQGVDRRVAALLVLALAWTTMSRFVVEPHFLQVYGIHRSPAGLALVGLAAPGVVALAASLRTVANPRGVAVWAGGLTYPLYLLHQAIGYAVFARFGTPDNRWIVAGLLVAVLLVLAGLVAAWVEPAGRRLVLAAAGALKRRWLAARSRPAPLSSA